MQCYIGSSALQLFQREGRKQYFLFPQKGTVVVSVFIAAITNYDNPVGFRQCP